MLFWRFWPKKIKKIWSIIFKWPQIIIERNEFHWDLDKVQFLIGVYISCEFDVVFTNFEVLVLFFFSKFFNRKFISFDDDLSPLKISKAYFL